MPRKEIDKMKVALPEYMVCLQPNNDKNITKATEEWANYFFYILEYNHPVISLTKLVLLEGIREKVIEALVVTEKEYQKLERIEVESYANSR